LKQLLVVFTPYPGLAAVRKVRFSMKGEWREQPFFWPFARLSSLLFISLPIDIGKSDQALSKWKTICHM
jgi:hypothetical protein